MDIIELLRKEQEEINNNLEGLRVSINENTNLRRQVQKLEYISANPNEFVEKSEYEFSNITKLSRLDVRFLFFAVALQCVRQYLLTPFSERLNDKEAAKKVKGNKEEHSNRGHKWYQPSLEEIISNPVPFDANRQHKNVRGVLQGAGKMGHRLLPGHDPILGWVVGTANIATSTLTKWDFSSYHIKTGIGNAGRGLEQCDYITNMADTGKVFSYTKRKLLDEGLPGKIIICTSLLKEWEHLKSDINTVKSLPFPIISSFSPKVANSMAEYGIDMANVFSVSKQAVTAQAINMLIAFVHGMCYYLSPELQKGDIALYKVKTHKIIMLSNLISSLSNVLATAMATKVGTEVGKKYLDVGGIVLTLHRLIADNKLINQIEEEFLATNWYKEVISIV